MSRWRRVDHTIGCAIVPAFVLVLVVSGPLTAGPGHGQSKNTASMIAAEPVPTAKNKAGSYQAIPYPIFYAVQQTDSLNASFDCFGRIGLSTSLPGFSLYDYGWPLVSFESPPGSDINYLYRGGLWIGGILGADTLVSTAYDLYTYAPDGLGEFRATNDQRTARAGTITPIESPADIAFRAQFDDTIHAGVFYYPDQATGAPHKPLNLDVTLKSYAWRSGVEANCVLYDAVITNIGGDEIHGGYVGLFIDPDISARQNYNGGFNDDMLGGIRGRGIAYGVDNDGDPRLGSFTADSSPVQGIGVTFLASSFAATDTGFNWWTSPWVDPGDIGPCRKPAFGGQPLEWNGAPYGNILEYQHLSSGEWDYDQCMLGTIETWDTTWVMPDAQFAQKYRFGGEISFVLSLGPFALPPDSSVRVLFTTMSAGVVHTDPYIRDFLFYAPELYPYVLDLDGLVRHADIADSLAEIIRTNVGPTTGLAVHIQDGDSIEVRWDPWVFDNVDGVNLYLAAIPSDSFRHPGVLPPWYRPDTIPLLRESLPGHRTVIRGLDHRLAYTLRAAYQGRDGVGPLTQAKTFRLMSRPAPPEIPVEHAFFSGTDGVAITWRPPTDHRAESYHLYRFANEAQADARYLPFYDVKGQYYPMTPVDTIVTPDTTYYYYAIQPLAVLPWSDSLFVDSDSRDGSIYALTAVDSSGYESPFGTPITAHLVPPRTKDVLVITYSGSSTNFVTFDTLRNFYQQILNGYQFDLFNYAESTNYSHCPQAGLHCIDWRDLLPYRLVIFDDGIRDRILYGNIEDSTVGVTQYLLSGGIVAYFGSLAALPLNPLTVNTRAGYYRFDHPLAQRFFGVDTVFFVGAGHYFFQGVLPPDDTLFGFSEAEAVDSALPGLSVDNSRSPFTGNLWQFWPQGTPPSVSTFHPTVTGRVTHRYRSRFPVSSVNEAQPVGIESRTAQSTAYLFGFHLWYMRPDQARALVEKILERAPTSVESPGSTIPAAFSLDQNYPNPFNAGTVIAFVLSTTCEVDLEIFNILGQGVRSLCHTPLTAGAHKLEWNGLSDGGVPVASGMYLYRLRAGSSVQTKKMLLLR
jgi:hypothetical protein